MDGGMTYIYAWKNNEKRAQLFGRKLEVLRRTKKMNSCIVRFIDNGQKEVISRSELRKLAL